MRTVLFPLKLEGVVGVVFQEMIKFLCFVRLFSFHRSLIFFLSRAGSPVVLQQGRESRTCTADNLS